MTGKDLKTKLELTGIPFRKIAELLGISEQNLQNKMSSADIKISFLYKISKALNKSIYFFLEDKYFNEENHEIVYDKQTNFQSPIIDSVYKVLYEEERHKNEELLISIGGFKKELEIKSKEVETKIKELKAMDFETDELVKRNQFLEQELTEHKKFTEETTLRSSKKSKKGTGAAGSADVPLGKNR
ncbi:hypothetical protein EZS27_012336 [termite gut metagenome]|uniref:Uncharacterized protein n=1 Tax=termite gut metagenome TaxID=433724 RepID=A0A5J4S1Y1_9ZZZZ